MNETRVGIVGAGNIANSRHIPVIKGNERTSIVGIYDSSGRKARETSQRFDIPFADDFTDLCEEADLISLCTPPAVHCEQTLAALDGDCHVLTEKPMAMSTNEADQMIAKAEDSNKILSVVHNFLYMTKMREARELDSEGFLGNINYTFAFLLKKGDEGKAYVNRAEADGLKGIRFWDESPHLIYLTREFLGDMRLENARIRLDDEENYRKLDTRFSASDGAEGIVSFVWDAPITEWWIVVVGTDGIVLVDIYRDILIRFSSEKKHYPPRILWVLLSGITQAGVGGFNAGIRYLYERLISGYRIPDAGLSHQIDGIIDAIEEGTDPPVTGVDGREILQYMEEIGYSIGLPIVQAE